MNSEITCLITAQRSDTHKYWNKHIRSCHPPPQPNALDTPNICWVVSTSSLPCCSFVGYELCSNSVINNMGFSAEVVYELDSLFFQTKHGSTWVHTLLLKTVKYGALKTHHMCWIKILCSHQRLVFGGHCLKSELRDHCSSKRQLLQKIIWLFWHSSLLCRKRMKGIVGFSKMGLLPILQQQQQIF